MLKNSFIKYKSSLYFIVYLFIVLLGVFQTKVYAQDLEKIGKKDPIKVNGGLSFSNIFYAVDGIQARRDPSLWFMSGNINFNLYGWSVPLSVSLSQHNKSTFQQPFNQYGLSPKYKWLTLHAGYRNLSFSPYTLAGHTFLGGGIEMNPGKYKFAAMYGRMLKAVDEDTLSTKSLSPSFQRMGWGWKAGYEDEGNGVEVSMFHAKDDIGSISYIPEKNDVKPGENLVLGISAKTKITKRFSVQGEFGNSAYTRDIRAEKSSSARSVYANLGNLFIYRTSTSNYSAYKLNGTYSLEKYTFGMTYERIQPGYRSMGTYFFNNDMENITVNTTARAKKDKVSIGLNLGTQRNNLQNTETNTVKRYIGSLNLTYTPNPKWNFNATYSNFQTSTAMSQRIQQFQNLDSLRFYQVSQSANGGLGYNGGNKERKHGVNLNLGYQVSKNTQKSNSDNNDSKFYNVNLSYRFTLVPKNVGISIGVNGNESVLSNTTTYTLGPTASINRSLFKKALRCTVSTSYNNVFTGGINTSTVLNFNFNNSFIFFKKHSIMLNAMVVNRQAKSSKSTNFIEYTCTVGYSFSF